MNQLSYNASLQRVITVTAGAAGTTDITGTGLDTSGYDGVLFILTFGAIVTGAVTSIKAQGSANSDMSSPVDLTGSAQTIADSDDEKIFYIDIYRPQHRYVTAFVDRGTQNATVTAVGILYHASKAPTTQGTNVSGETFTSPAAGTA